MTEESNKPEREPLDRDLYEADDATYPRDRRGKRDRGYYGARSADYDRELRDRDEEFYADPDYEYEPGAPIEERDYYALRDTDRGPRRRKGGRGHRKHDSGDRYYDYDRGARTPLHEYVSRTYSDQVDQRELEQEREAPWKGDYRYARRRERYRGRRHFAPWMDGPYSGVGPRGYRRPNESIREEANERLTRHGWVDATDIEVSVEDGEITLEGTVGSRREKRMAEDVLESIAGVRDIHNRLRIRREDEESDET